MDRKDIMDLIPLDNHTQKLAQDIIDEQDISKIKDLTYLFNLNQAKKNVARILKLNSLLDKVSDEMIQRVERRPGEFSNSDLLNFLQVTQSSIDRSNKSLNLVDETPAIQLNQVNINVEESMLDRESRNKVTEAVKQILSKLKLPNTLENKEEQIENVDLIIEDNSENNLEENEN